MNINKYIKAVYKVITNKNYRFLILSEKGVYDDMDDENYLKRKYKACLGKELNLDSPKTFNEKLQWLKLYNRKPEYTMMVDKYAVRKYIADTIGEEYLIPLLGVWDNPDDIDFDALPNQFVLKCNHNSGLGMCICKDKSKLDIDKIKAELRKGLQQDYYLTGREWPYKNVKRIIIAEKYMTTLGMDDLPDYKIHCFNGEPKFILYCSERFSKTGTKEDFLDTNWSKLPFKRPDLKCSDKILKKPSRLNEMLELAKILSTNIPFLRCDFYEIKGNVYFGELTFFPASGLEAFEPEEWDYKLGNWLKLPIK